MITTKTIKWIIRVVAIAIPFAGIWLGYNIIGWSFTADCNVLLGMLSLMLGGFICITCGVVLGYAIKYVIDIVPTFLDWLFKD